MGQTREGNGNPLQYSCLKIPWMEEPGGLSSMGSHRVEHDWSDLAAAAAAGPSLEFLIQLHWSGAWASVFLESLFCALTLQPELKPLGEPKLHNLDSSSREGNGTPLQYSCLENPMEGGAWWAAVHGVAKSWTRLSDFTFTFHFHALEKEMATHSSVLAWRIPGTGEPGGLPSMGSHRIGHDWSELAAADSSRVVR